jgi:CDP-glucose 4,6-dehydratase
MEFLDFYRSKRVLLTGHTGFKGSWLAEWLLSLGAEVHGFALDPQPHESLFDQLGLGHRLASDTRADLGDAKRISACVDNIQPEVILHLAAQPLVRLSYEIPVATFAANVMGTAHVLEAVRGSSHPCTVVAITTDKCYENREWLHAYREEDPMGGHDPYSASKGAAELVISCYRNSFFQAGGRVRLASARAGNVLGGGDWAQDRIVPDCFRSLRVGRAVEVRNKFATRPWQHVLEPLSGYLWLAARLATADHQVGNLASSFNFGPALTSNRTVLDLVHELLKHTGGEWIDTSEPNARHEASMLNLAIDKAFHLLQWRPVWSFEETMARTAEWYLESNKLPFSASHAPLTLAQIQAYTTAARVARLPWAE